MSESNELVVDLLRAGAKVPVSTGELHEALGTIATRVEVGVFTGAVETIALRCYGVCYTGLAGGSEWNEVRALAIGSVWRNVIEKRVEFKRGPVYYVLGENSVVVTERASELSARFAATIALLNEEDAGRMALAFTALIANESRTVNWPQPPVYGGPLPPVAIAGNVGLQEQLAALGVSPGQWFPAKQWFPAE